MAGFAAASVMVADPAVVAPVAVIPEAAVPSAHFIGPVPSFPTAQPFAAKVDPELNPPSVAGLIIVVCA